MTASSSSYGLTQSSSYKQAVGMSSGSYSSSSGFIGSIIGAAFSPIITGIIPAEGKNIAPVSVTITGANFATGLTVKLTSTTEADISGIDIAAAAGSITCKFNLSGANEGLRNVVIVNPDGTQTQLASAFKVTSYGLPMGLAVNSPNPFNPMTVNLYIFNTSADLIYKMNFLSGQNGGKKGDNSVTWNGTNGFGEVSGTGLYLLHLIDKNTGKIKARGKIAVYVK
ncbi:MAG: hypothetical protein NTZ10_00915 [Candidatus Saganbacteria bacterium]|nr:hypothetical protein [Candidatus Saganbacteria bacterium]